MHPLSFLKVLIYLGLWMLGCFIIPVALICLPFGIYGPLYLLILYYSIRIFFKPRKSDTIRSFLSLEHTPYFNKQDVVLDEGVEAPKPNSKTMVACAPHGILCIGWGLINTSDQFLHSGITWLVASILMDLPFASDILTFTSTDRCNAETMTRLMEKGENVALLPGGFEEATLYKRGHHRVYLKNRKGFIKFALKYGYSIHPVYVFGEEMTFWTIRLVPARVLLWLNKHSIPGSLFMGKFLFFPDNDASVTCVVGNAFKVPLIPNYTPEDVDKYHKMYIESLQALFNKHKGKYAVDGDKAELEIV